MIGSLIARDVRRGFTGAAWLPIGFFLLSGVLFRTHDLSAAWHIYAGLATPPDWQKQALFAYS